MPARVDAIIVLGGGGDRLGLGMRLAQEDKASYLVLSRGLPWIPPGICTGHVGQAKVICFNPNPATTQGEAEGASRIARNYGWISMVLVTTEDQPARLLASLAFDLSAPSVARQPVASPTRCASGNGRWARQRNSLLANNRDRDANAN